jgi:hypothetical protein
LYSEEKPLKRPDSNRHTAFVKDSNPRALVRAHVQSLFTPEFFCPEEFGLFSSENPKITARIVDFISILLPNFKS